ncbi:hypothetical protein CEXT_331201 [Caerostris extrusa]|uniref:Uncharacterized protein n=1 Tax=Caerostris extrusa TaxID=172846 RepID=A0AAV4QN86_CAEEX|nr:hypothetical protein CEXT_331201 [Caerostris extrusa]
MSIRHQRKPSQAAYHAFGVVLSRVSGKDYLGVDGRRMPDRGTSGLVGASANPVWYHMLGPVPCSLRGSNQPGVLTQPAGVHSTTSLQTGRGNFS